jgi:hypothetical protein
MGWNEMEKIKTIGIYPYSSKDGEKTVLDFNIENFINYKLLLDGTFLKFVQVNINEKPYLRMWVAYHSSILERLLSEFNMKFDKISNNSGLVPSVKGDNYELVGAGKIRLLGDKLNFYDASTDYMVYVRGTNRKNLEEIFGKENLTESEGKIASSFFVDFK